VVENLLVDKNLSVEERYRTVVAQAKHLLNKDDQLITNLSNLTALLKQSFDKISWVGFYLFDGTKLYLGPFQGKVACTQIEIGKGVCGTAADNKKTIIVPDVDEFPGHIACDADSKSEIVVPILKNEKLFGVLDLDSHLQNSFNDTDKLFLEELCSFLSDYIIQKD
jgi:L-methionine (R)-S-oxide reductase